MRRDLFKDVKIVEPPIEELSKRRSGFWRGCVTGCGFLILIIIGMIVFVRVYTGPGPQTLKKVPENFPKDIPVYDPDNIISINYIAGRYKSRRLELAALLPKILLSSLFINAENTESTATGKNNSANKTSAWKEFWEMIYTPVSDKRDTIQIEWSKIDAEANFVISYYQTDLNKAKYQIDAKSEGNETRQFTFHRADGLSGSLFVQGEKQVGTDYALLTISLPETN